MSENFNPIQTPVKSKNKHFKTNNNDNLLNVNPTYIECKTPEKKQLLSDLYTGEEPSIVDFPILACEGISKLAEELDSNHQLDLSHIDDHTLDLIDMVYRVRQVGPQPFVNSPLPISENPRKLTICIDMDETMSTMTFKPLPDRLIDLCVYGTEGDVAFVYFRPHLRAFLEALRLRSRQVEVIVFTAATPDYADQVLNHIDPLNVLFDHRLYRNNCQECVNNSSQLDNNNCRFYIKDLRVVNRNLSSVILIDNSLFSFAFNLENGFLIDPFLGDFDHELIRLLPVINTCIEAVDRGDDVRDILNNIFKFNILLDQYSSLVN